MTAQLCFLLMAALPITHTSSNDVQAMVDALVATAEVHRHPFDVQACEPYEYQPFMELSIDIEAPMEAGRPGRRVTVRSIGQVSVHSWNSEYGFETPDDMLLQPNAELWIRAMWIVDASNERVLFLHEFIDPTVPAVVEWTPPQMSVGTRLKAYSLSRNGSVWEGNSVQVEWGRSPNIMLADTAEGLLNLPHHDIGVAPASWAATSATHASRVVAEAEGREV